MSQSCAYTKMWLVERSARKIIGVASWREIPLHKLAMRWLLFAAISVTMALPALAGERVSGDFNFDGYPDYRVERSTSGELHYSDFYLYDPQEKKNVFSKEFSETLFNPVFDSGKKEIHCIAPGGKNPALFYEEDYRVEENNTLKLVRMIRQEKLDMKDGQLHYVRVAISMQSGKPEVESITALEPDEVK